VRTGRLRKNPSSGDISKAQSSLLDSRPWQSSAGGQGVRKYLISIYILLMSFQWNYSNLVGLNYSLWFLDPGCMKHSQQELVMTGV